MAATHFFQNQQAARTATGRLLVLFALAVVGVVLAMNIAAHFIFYIGAGLPVQGHAGLSTRAHVAIALGTLGIILAGGLWRQWQLTLGGCTIAYLLGGREVSRDTTDANERRLINVVEEMAIASGVPAPPVFVIEEMSINAFAAGEAPTNAVVGVTRGTIDSLSRDELQGVIAHEFSHIFNGDMRLNLKLIGYLAGIQTIGSIGLGILRGFGRSGRSRSSRNAKGGGAIIFVGVALTVIGYVGVFFARLIKSAISRQREYLADASAVQYTRNPHGIGGALMKIRANVLGATVHGQYVEEASHMFFGSALDSFFATHPPIEDRIKKIDSSLLTRKPSVRPEVQNDTKPELPEENRRRNALNSILAGTTIMMDKTGAPITPRTPTPMSAQTSVKMSTAQVMNSIGQPSDEHISAASAFLASVPERVKNAAHDTFGAQCVVFALLIHDRDYTAAEHLKAKNPRMHQVFVTLLPDIHSLGPVARIPLLELCLPALKALAKSQRAQFLLVVKDVIWADDRCETFEYALFTILVEQLSGRRKRLMARSLPTVGAHAALMLSALAHFGHVERPESKDAVKAFGAGVSILISKTKMTALPIVTGEQCKPEAMERALRMLSELKPSDKEIFVEACVATIIADGRVAIDEYELLHAYCTALEVPLPPLIVSA